MKQYDPNWPFPQYDENGKQLLPPKEPRKTAYERAAENAEEAML
jgi:hypothetical protein